MRTFSGANLFDPVQFSTTQLDFRPDAHQARVLDPHIHRGILNCTRQWGKSTVAAVKAVHHAATRAESSVIVVAPSERQSAELVRKCSRFLAKLDLPAKSDRSNRASLVLSNGSRILGFPASNERLRGFSATLLIIDEAAHVSDELYRTVRPFLAATDGQLWLLSTPNGKQGFFYDEWVAANSEFTRISVPAPECSRISPKFLAEERARMTEAQFAQEYLCQFGDTNSSLFCPDDIKALIQPNLEPLFPSPNIHRNLSIPPAAEPTHPGWNHYFIGLDLGQSRDHTAISVIEQKTFFTNLRDPIDFAHLAFCRLRLRHIEKIPLRTAYSDAINRTLEIAAATNERPFISETFQHPTPTTLIIDATGVGRPILEMIRKEQRRSPATRAQIIGVNITGGQKARYSEGIYQVPKRDLVTAFQLAVENQDLDISSGLHDQRALLHELARFERRLTAYGNETFEAASGHDDLVMSLLLAVYWGFRNPPPTNRNAQITRMVPRNAIPLSQSDLTRLGLPNFSTNN